MTETKQHCPKCQGHLWHLNRKGIVIEMCSRCQGLWFDAGELTMLIEVYRAIDDSEAANSGVPCLRCETDMKVLDFPGTDIEIDRCPACQGVWLDKGELELLRLALKSNLPKDTDQSLNDRAMEILSEAELFGKRAFSCPKCPGKLWHLKRSGMIVEMCSKCAGMWFDAGELTLLIEVYKKIPADAGEPVDVACVRCGESMHELKFPGTDIEVDRCRACQGIWLDKGEFKSLKAAFENVTRREEVSWGDRAKEIWTAADLAIKERVVCPRCQGKLVDDRQSGLPVERCEACKGTWFDAGELTVVLGVSRKIRLSEADKSELKCIKCPAETLLKMNYPRTEVEIDTCPDCRSIWLDGGELEQLAAAVGKPFI